MSERESWVVLQTTGLALVVVGTLPLESAPWPLQYGVLALGLLLTLGGFVRAAESA